MAELDDIMREQMNKQLQRFELEYAEILSGLDLEDQVHLIELVESEIEQGNDPEEVVWEFLNDLAFEG